MKTNLKQLDEPTKSQSRVPRIVPIGLAAWGMFCLVCILFVYPTAIYWISYYAADFQFGFVRRGLIGELIRYLPDDQYLTARYAIMWTSVIVWLIAVSVLMWLIYSRGGRSERSKMLALLVSTLPFTFFYSILSPRPELFAMTALLAFSISLTCVDAVRHRLTLSALFGLLIAVLAFQHEAIPLEVALGAVLAIVVLSNDATYRVQRVCMTFAIGPGLLSVLVIATFGRQDIGGKLCTQIPHVMIRNPYASTLSPNDIGEYRFGQPVIKSDYGAWACNNVLADLDHSLRDGIASVTNMGMSALLTSCAFGLAAFAFTLWAIGYVSAVPVKDFVYQVRRNVTPTVFAASLMVPVFLTGFDWIRWWVVITCGVAIVYILFAIGRPAFKQTPSRNSVRIFVWIVVVMAVVSTRAGTSPHFGGPTFNASTIQTTAHATIMAHP